MISMESMGRARAASSGSLPAAACAVLVASCGRDSGRTADAAVDEPAPVPIVSSMTPSSGAYGTELLIEGEGFGNVPRLLDLTSADGAVHEFESSEWTDNLIRARIKFPAESGEVGFCASTRARLTAPGCSASR